MLAIAGRLYWMYMLRVLLVQVRGSGDCKDPFRHLDNWRDAVISVIKAWLIQYDAIHKLVGLIPGAANDFSEGISVNISLCLE